MIGNTGIQLTLAKWKGDRRGTIKLLKIELTTIAISIQLD
jgi:hypothetical protein